MAPAPEIIGPYRILDTLGSGGQGVVYLAEDQRLSRRVALKVLTGLGPLSDDALRRFQREAAVASRLDHPGICTVHDTGVEERVAYIAMRYIEGQSLSQKLAESRSTTTRDESSILDLESATEDDDEAVVEPDTSATPTKSDVDVAIQLIEDTARALHAAHEAGVIHRDVKPGNVMITPAGRPVILDFGLAREEEGDLPTLTRTGDFFGTPSYMSPEQLMSQRLRVDRRADIWSLGVMLYECITLTRPFQAPTRESLYHSILTKEPVDPRKHNPVVPRDLAVVVSTALEKDRDRRYQTARDLAEDLRRVRELLPIKARPAGPVLRLRRWGQRNPALATAAVLLLVFVVAGVSLLGWANLRLSEANDELEAANAEATKQEATARRERDEKGRALDAEKKTRHRADGLRLLGEARQHLENDPALAALLATQGARRTPGPVADSLLSKVLEELHEERTFQPNVGALASVMFSPDGNKLAVLGSSGDLIAWNADDGTRLFHVRVPMRSFSAGAAIFDPTGYTLLVVGTHGESPLPDATTGRVLSKLLHPQRSVNHVRFSDDGRLCALATSDGTMVWSVPDGALRHEYPASIPHLAVDFDQGAGTVLTADAMGQIHIISRVSGETRLIDYGRSIRFARFSYDGRQVLVPIGEGVMRWETATGTRLPALGRTGGMQLTGGFTVDKLAVARQGLYTVSDVRSRSTAIWRKDKAVGTVPGAIMSTAGSCVSKRSGRLVTVENRIARVWRLDDGRLVATLRGHSSAIVSAVIDPDGRRVATVSTDGTCRTWRVRAWLDERTIRVSGKPGNHRFFGLDRNRRRLLTSSGALLGGRHLEGSDVTTGRVIRRFSTRTHPQRQPVIEDADVGPNGKTVATAHDDWTARIWNVSEGRVTHALVHDKPVKSIEFSPSGRRVLTVTSDASASIPSRSMTTVGPTTSFDGRTADASQIPPSATVWNPKTGKQLGTLRTHAGSIECATFDAVEERVATGGWDGKIIIWNATTGEELATWSGKVAVREVRFTSDGKRIVARFDTKPPVVINAATGEELAQAARPSLVAQYEYTALAVRPDGQSAAITVDVFRDLNLVLVFDLDTGRTLQRLDAPLTKVEFMEFSRDGRSLLTATRKQPVVHVTDLETGRAQGTFSWPNRSLAYAGLDSTGTHVVAIDAKESTVRSWPLQPLRNVEARLPRPLTLRERERFETDSAADLTKANAVTRWRLDQDGLLDLADAVGLENVRLRETLSIYARPRIDESSLYTQLLEAVASNPRDDPSISAARRLCERLGGAQPKRRYQAIRAWLEVQAGHPTDALRILDATTEEDTWFHDRIAAGVRALALHAAGRVEEGRQAANAWRRDRTTLKTNSLMRTVGRALRDRFGPDASGGDH
ncbi:MAG: hypothetical protein CMJ83_11255 [Planctomycetes bacterium]|nr:hypothetical protein [Planctomycetota bacterium]